MRRPSLVFVLYKDGFSLLIFPFCVPAEDETTKEKVLVNDVDCIILEEYRLWYRSNDVFYINSQSLVVLLLLAGRHQIESSPMLLTHNFPTPKRVIEYYLMIDDER